MGCNEAEATIRANAFDTVEDLIDARLEEADLKDLGMFAGQPAVSSRRVYHFYMSSCMPTAALQCAHCYRRLCFDESTEEDAARASRLGGATT